MHSEADRDAIHVRQADQALCIGPAAPVHSYLNQAAIKLLRSMPRMQRNPHVIAGHKSGAHLVEIQKPWRRIRKRAGLAGVRIHDLEFVVIGPDFNAAALEPEFEAAAAFGAKRVSCCGADPKRARLIASVAALCDCAARHGIGVDLECMAWRDVASIGDAATVIREVGHPDAGVLVDALHLARTGGAPGDVAVLPSALVRSAQLCDAPARRPPTIEAIIAEARGKRMPPGAGELPLRDLLNALPSDVALSVEAPMDDGRPAEERARDLFDATRRLLAAMSP